MHGIYLVRGFFFTDGAWRRVWPRGAWAHLSRSLQGAQPHHSHSRGHLSDRHLSWSMFKVILLILYHQSHSKINISQFQAGAETSSTTLMWWVSTQLSFDHKVFFNSCQLMDVPEERSSFQIFPQLNFDQVCSLPHPISWGSIRCQRGGWTGQDLRLVKMTTWMMAIATSIMATVMRVLCQVTGEESPGVGHQLPYCQAVVQVTSCLVSTNQHLLKPNWILPTHVGGAKTFLRCSNLPTSQNHQVKLSYSHLWKPLAMNHVKWVLL